MLLVHTPPLRMLWSAHEGSTEPGPCSEEDDTHILEVGAIRVLYIAKDLSDLVEEPE